MIQSGVPNLHCEDTAACMEPFTSKYRTILFDADDTLFDFEKAERYALETACREGGIEFDGSVHGSAYRTINREIWEEFERKRITLEELRPERWRRFFHRFSLPHDPHEFSARFLGHLAAGAFLIPGAVEAVQALASGRTLAIVTNGIREVQRRRFAASPLAGLIPHLIVSEDAGAAKPDPAFFRYAFERIGIPEHEKSRVLIVGDSLSSDIQGGILFGIDTCWFNPGAAANETPFTPDYEIRSLAELTGR